MEALTGTYIDDTDCSHAINYVDGSMTQPVYTSFCFQPASSLSHFEDYCQVPSSFVLAPPASNNQYFVMANALVPGPYSPTTSPGAMKRYLKPEERQVLCDIGYIVDTVFGDSANLNYNNYNTTICGNQVAGINDGITSIGTYKYFTSGTTPVTIDSLLSNDYNADSFKCLEVIIGSGTVSTTHGTNATTITFTPAAGTYGVQLLRYIPKNTATGSQGNITYVYVFVGDTSCVPTACDLVTNGGFEHTNPLITPYYSGSIHCWTSLAGTPDLYSRGAASFTIPFTGCTVTTDVHAPGSTIPDPNNHFVALGGYEGRYGWYGGEALQEALTSSLVSGNSYTLNFWAKMANHLPGQYDNYPSKIQFAVGSSVAPYVFMGLITYINALPLPDSLIPLMDTMVQYTTPYSTMYDGWQHFSKTFTYTGTHPGNTLVVISAPYLNPATPPYSSGMYATYMLVDDVSLVPAGTLATFNLPDTMCTSDGIINMDTLVSIPGGTFDWLTGVHGTVTHDSLFRPDSAYYATASGGTPGIVTVCYNYTDGSGCALQVCATTHIFPPPSAISGSIGCLGTTTTLSDAVAGGTWSSSDTTIATIGSTTGIVTGISLGTVTITYKITSSCTVTKVITINPMPSAITGTAVVCAGSTTNLTDSTAGGTWSSSNTGIATVGSTTGIVTGVSAGTATITYMLAGCYKTIIVTVNPSPTAINGNLSVCLGLTQTLTDGIGGGTWTSGNTGVATIGSSSGVVTGIALGTATITYALSDGCNPVYATVTVNPLPDSITGTLQVCVGSTTNLTDATAGGTWSSGSTGIATVGSATGIVTGVASGTARITYKLPVLPVIENYLRLQT